MRTAARIAVGAGAALALAAPATAPAAAGRDDHVARSFTQAASSGLPVTGPLAPRRAVARVRVVVPARWRVRSAPRGQLRVLTPGTSCRYVVTFRVATGAGAPEDVSARVDRLLPSPGAKRVLEDGRRNAAAFRVVRLRSDDTRVRLRGLRSGVLTRRDDVVAAGQVAWGDLTASAVSRRGDECHSGTYRQVLGPQLGDALATARMTLRFAAP